MLKFFICHNQLLFQTFEYAIKDLIETNAGNGLKSYLEALLCLEINKNFQYDFESANDFLNIIKNFYWIKIIILMCMINML